MYTSIWFPSYYFYWLCWVFLVAQVFSLVVSGGYSLLGVEGPVIVVASLVVEYRF